MKEFIASTVLACVCVGTCCAQPPQPSKDASEINAIKQLEQSMGDAMLRADVAVLSQIYADDFATIGASGKVFTKKDLLTDFASFHDKLESFENGAIDVQVFGNVAVAHGGVIEKRLRDGKDVSGEFVWMDLLEKRAGQWQVVRSGGSRVKSG